MMNYKYQDLRNWTLRMESTYKLDLWGEIQKWGQRNKIPGKMKKWSESQIKEAIDFASGLIVNDK